MIYLDNAATTYMKPRKVFEATGKSYANPGRGGHKLACAAGDIIYKCREALCDFLSAENPCNIIFTCNTTDALNIAIKGLIKQGDHVITSGMEHNSVIRPLIGVGADISIAMPDLAGRVDASKILPLIRDNTRLIAITHASNICGTINPIREIGSLSRSHGIPFLVDAAQTAGVFPINVQDANIDFLAFAGHKLLFGPQGTGGLYIKNPDLLTPFREGGTGSLSESLEQPNFLPDKFESGTLNTNGIAGLLEGVKFITRTGLDTISSREEELTELLLEGLKTMPNVTIYGEPEAVGRVGVVGFNIEGIDCVDVSAALSEKYGIASRAGLHCAALAHKSMGTTDIGMIRLSVSFLNKKSDIKIALGALKKISTEAI